MQTLIYEGKIEPEAAPLTLEYRPKLRRQETETAPEAEFDLREGGAYRLANLARPLPR